MSIKVQCFKYYGFVPLANYFPTAKLEFCRTLIAEMKFKWLWLTLASYAELGMEFKCLSNLNLTTFA